MAAGAPVDDILALVDQAFFVQTAEYSAHSLRQALVHREAFTFPVAGVSQRLHLIDDAVAVLFFPLPGALDERLTAKVMARLAFAGKTALNHVLRSDAGVIGARQPEHGIAASALIAGKDVLERLIVSVSHVQSAGNVRRGQHDRKRFFALVDFRVEQLLVDPPLIPLAFKRRGIVIL